MRFQRTLRACLGALIFIPLAAGLCAASPCDLLTKNEAEEILGEEAAAPRQSPVAGMAAGTQCLYMTAAQMAKRGSVGSLAIVVHDPVTMQKKGKAFKDPAQFFAKSLKAKKGSHAKIEEIAGLGERAYWEPGADALHVLAQGFYLRLKVKDLAKMQAKNQKELDAKLSAHRRALAEKAMRQYILPRLKTYKP